MPPVSLYRPGAAYEIFAGRLYVRSRRETLTVNPWGRGMGAWILHGRTTWAEASLDFSISFLSLAPDPWARFLIQQWPAEVRTALQGLHVPNWTLLRLANEAGSGFLQLIDSNPALGALLGWSVDRGFPLRQAAALAGRKRRQILGELGLPPAGCLVRILGRIHFSEVVPEIFEMLPRCRDELSAIAYWPHICSRTLALVANPELAAITTPRFRHEFAAAPGPAQRAAIASLQRIAAAVETRRFDLPPIDRLARLENVAAGIREILDRSRLSGGSTLRFPPPPLPPGPAMEPITSQAALQAEGEHMHHCCAGYAGRVRAGEIYFYKINEPERLTVSIERRPHGWVLGQVRGTANRTPQLRTLGILWQWTGERHLSQTPAAPQPRPDRPLARRGRRRADERQLTFDFL